MGPAAQIPQGPGAHPIRPTYERILPTRTDEGEAERPCHWPGGYKGSDINQSPYPILIVDKTPDHIFSGFFTIFTVYLGILERLPIENTNNNR